MPKKSRLSALRIGRFSQTGQIYLVTATTFARERVFAQWLTGRLLVGELKQAHESGLVRSLAWVVMPDHLHWLFELRTGSLAAVMQRVKSKTAKAVNKAHGRQGKVWQDGYHDKAIRQEKDLVHVARYIVANPVRAGLVKSLRDYPLWDAVWI